MRFDYFQMIDRVEELRLEKAEIVVSAAVPEESTIFEGHFPGHPLVPGVLLIEAMAQASGYLLLALNDYKRMVFLASVKEAKLRSFVPPGVMLSIEASREHDGSGYAVTKAKVLLDGKRICNAQLSFRVVDFPSPDVEEHVRQRARDTGLLTAGA